jgi:hypothetical protein
MQDVLQELVRLAVEQYGSRLHVDGETFVIDGHRLHFRLGNRGKTVGICLEGVWIWQKPFPYVEVLGCLDAMLEREKLARRKLFETP